MNDFEFMLEDRIAKIRAINEQYNLLDNSYIAFSGGKDSVIVSHLIDLALPNNKIPRVFANTGIEYNLMVKYVKDLSQSDDRIIILNQKRNIKKTLEKHGYPFKSKEHSDKVEQFNKGNMPPYLKNYLDYNAKKGFKCPKMLLYQFNERGKYNYSKKCCQKLKKDLTKDWQKENNKTMVITGLRKEEGGSRRNISCITTNNTHFNPISVVNSDWENEYLKRFNIKLCDLYYEPYNFKRTGCKGCPFNRFIQKDLDILYELLPNEYKQCLHLWKPVYDEYIRIGYRLKRYPHEEGGDK